VNGARKTRTYIKEEKTRGKRVRGGGEHRKSALGRGHLNRGKRTGEGRAQDFHEVASSGVMGENKKQGSGRWRVSGGGKPAGDERDFIGVFTSVPTRSEEGGSTFCFGGKKVRDRRKPE